MKAVLDTNVWLDWLVFDDPSSRALGALAGVGGLELPASTSTRAEWLDVLSRPQFGLDEAARLAIVARYDAQVRLVDGSGLTTLACRDPDDQKFLELAVAVGAGYLVTRDRALLDLARPALRLHGLAILRPGDARWDEALAALAAAASRDCAVRSAATGAATGPL